MNRRFMQTTKRYLRDVRTISNVKESPRTARGAGVLASHEKCDHDVRNFVILERAAGAVFLRHESSDHIVFLLLVEVQPEFQQED